MKGKSQKHSDTCSRRYRFRASCYIRSLCRNWWPYISHL